MISVGVGVNVRRRTAIIAGAIAPLTATATPIYNSDATFNAAANGTLLRSLSPWQAISSTGSVAAQDRDSAIMTANRIDINGTLNNFDPNTIGTHLFGIQTSSARHFMEYTVDQKDGHHASFAATDNTLRTEFKTNSYNGAALEWNGTVRAVVAQTVEPLYLQDVLARFVEGRGFASGSRFKIAVLNNKAVAYLNGVRLATFPVANSGTFVGFGSGAENYQSARNITVGLTRTQFKINSNGNKQWYNRIKGWTALANGGRRITYTGTWEGEKPTGLYWQLVRPTDGTVIKAWAGVDFAQTTITTTSGTGINQIGTFSYSVDVEAGLDGRLPYRMRVGGRTGGVFGQNGLGESVNHDFDWDTEKQFFYITVGVVWMGQSEAAGANSTVAGVGYPDHPGGGFYQIANDPGVGTNLELPYLLNTPWHQSQTDTNNVTDRQCAWFTDALSLAMNMPVSVTIVARGSRLSSNIGPGGESWTDIQAHLGFIGAYEYEVNAQGSAEIFTNSGVAAWSLNTKNNVVAYRAYMNQPGSHVPYTFLVPTGFCSFPGDVRPGNAASAANIRAQQNAFPAYMTSFGLNAVLACSFIDLPDLLNGEFTDGMRGGGEGFRRVAITMANTIGATNNGMGTINGRGPTIATVQKISTTLIRLTYAANGSTSIVGTLANANYFVGTDSGLVTRLTGVTAAYNAGAGAYVVDLTIPVTAGTCWVSDYWDENPSQSGRPVGQYATNGGRALTLPVYPMFVPVQAS